MRIPVNQPYTTTQSIPFGGADSAAKFGKHAGIDYALPTGREVYAPVSGVVTSYTSGQYHGKVVEIKGDDGNYYHMLHNSILKVISGQRVTEGKLVSLSGATGQGITGPHVHFGVATKSLPNVTSFNDFINPNNLVGGSNVIIGSGENWYARLNQLHEFVLNAPLGRDTFNSFVGKDTLKFMEAVQDHPLAAQVQAMQKLGQRAKDGFWEEELASTRKERDEVLYPYVAAVTTELKVPNTADIAPSVEAIKTLASQEYVKISDLYMKKG